MSLPEVLLWQRFRQRPAGIKLRRQHPVGGFVADFYCAASRTVFEIDGISHDMGARPLADARRSAWMKRHGLRVIRIPAADVLRDPDATAQAIITACQAAPPPSALGAATSPAGGGSEGT
ncbi:MULTISPECIES: endonuclease domain-containing protein [Novosphingobium]|uniref:endonuclease domain-containing protein n=1 Tax=Novosphingobium TaxID=165696 RepID=UPI00286B87F1|nr:endonuclease domain-containing protein [Novosphingobium capsulatum]